MHHVVQVGGRIDGAKLVKVRLAPYGLTEFGADALHQIVRKPHGFGHNQDVAEQDGGVHPVGIDGLDGHFGRAVGIEQELLEAAYLGANGPVFWEGSSRLTHHPHRHALHVLPPHGPQDQIVLKSLHATKVSAKP